MEDKEKGLQGGNPEAQEDEKYLSPDNANPESTQSPVNWQGDDRIILHDQAAVAAYFNKHDDLVIEQCDTLGNEGFIVIAPELVKLFAQAISRLAGDTTAERARRYREKKKRDANVTQRDAERDGRDANVTELRVVKASS